MTGNKGGHPELLKESINNGTSDPNIFDWIIRQFVIIVRIW